MINECESSKGWEYNKQKRFFTFFLLWVLQSGK